MTPNWQSLAYALFARRPIVPQPPDVLAADPPASREPLPPSGIEDTPVTECPLPRQPPPPCGSLSLSSFARKPLQPIANPFPSRSHRYKAIRPPLSAAALSCVSPACSTGPSNGFGRQPLGASWPYSPPMSEREKPGSPSPSRPRSAVPRPLQRRTKRSPNSLGGRENKNLAIFVKQRT